MKKNNSLFICTKPYQYLIINLIIKSFELKNNSLVILNHFSGAKNFYEKIKKAESWKDIYFINDTNIINKQKKLSYIKKVIYYNKWNKIYNELESFKKYDQLFIAHDTVLVEYAFMRYFKKMDKNVFLYEEGVDNYKNINFKSNYLLKYIKKFSNLLNIPGDALGKSKFVDEIFLQNPEIAKNNLKSINKKIKKIPLSLDKLLNDESFIEHLNIIFDKMKDITLDSDSETINIFLGDPNIFKISQLKSLRNYFYNNINNESTLYIKQHPAEKKRYVMNLSNNDLYIPQNIPIEIFSSKMIKNNIKTLNVFSFGSTALINLYQLLKGNIKMNFYIFKTNDLKEEFNNAFKKNLELYDDFKIKYKIIYLRSKVN
ncbi:MULTISPECIES: polysialyltransferase family glycosyltransferase [Petrotogaceae]|uniref:Glycosyltransferase family 52 n=1 Tax=Geotoga petraea TaxID=28234 RepID=A0A1G6PIJ0_9BACT|nr:MULTISPECIES: polysialyltransferase family glycosyltransferase [Petrotogaceae]MDO7975857.1 glycosyltransferase family 52 protein [Oceanotoga teriensis]SDC79973.1 Glycosyltransferase family 52 [Geotoga petraea]